MRISLSIFFVVCWSFFMGASWANTSTMSCPKVVRYALENNPAWRAKRAKLVIALQRYQASKIFPTNPSFETLGKGKKVLEKTGFYKLEFALTWKLPIGGRWGNRQRWMKKSVEKVQAELKQAEFSLALKVQKACFSYLLQKRKVTAYKNLVAFYQRAFMLINKRKITGDATVLDLNLAKLELVRNKASLLLEETKQKRKKQYLIQLLGWKAKKPPVVTGSLLPQLTITKSLQELQERGSQHHVLLASLRKKIEESRAKISWARSKAIPDLKFKVYYALEDGDRHVFGGGLSLPIPTFQRNQEKIWVTQKKLSQQRLFVAATKFQLKQKIKQSFLQFQASRKVFFMYEKEVIPTLSKQRKLRERGLRLGLFTSIQVLSAQQSQNKTVLKQLESLKFLIYAFVHLQKFVGGLFKQKTAN